MSAVTRRLLGVGVAVLALLGAASLFFSQRANQLKVTRERVQAEVEAQLPRVVTSLEALQQDVAAKAERGAQVEAIGALVQEITSQSDIEPLSKTLADFDVQPFFAPYAAVGPHAFFLGRIPLYSTDPKLVPTLQPLVDLAVTSGRATAVAGYGGAVWLVGVGRSEKTSPQQQPMLLALAQQFTPAQAAELAGKHGVSMLVVPGNTLGDAVGGGADVETLKQKFAGGAADAFTARKELVPGVELLLAKDGAAQLTAARTEANAGAVPIFGVAGLLAVAALVFGFLPRREPAQDEAHTLLLRETAAQLKQSQEQLQRLSQRLEPNTNRFEGGGAPGALGKTSWARRRPRCSSRATRWWRRWVKAAWRRSRWRWCAAPRASGAPSCSSGCASR